MDGPSYVKIQPSGSGMVEGEGERAAGKRRAVDYPENVVVEGEDERAADKRRAVDYTDILKDERLEWYRNEERNERRKMENIRILRDCRGVR